jgi:4-hydroxybenzoate polyprenyltransferase
MTFLLPLIVGSLLMGASFVLFGLSLAKKESLNRLLFWLSFVSSLLGIGYSILCFVLTASRPYTFYLQLVYPVAWLLVLIFGFVYVQKKAKVATSASQKA